MREWVALLVEREPACIEQAKAFIQSLPADTTVLCGGERASDNEVATAAGARGLRTICYEPRREALGAEAGVTRNREMVDDASRVVAFHTGKSWGILTTLHYARQQGKKVEVFRP